MDTVEELDKQARESAERANQISSEYSKNTGTIYKEPSSAHTNIDK